VSKVFLWRMLGFTWLLACIPAAWSQSGLGVVQTVDVIRTTAHIDVVLLLNCRARYVTHSPSGESDVVRVRLSLAEDCGIGGGETLPVAAEAEIIRSIEVAPLLARDVDLIVRWQHSERFVVLPTSDQQGVRLRLLRPGREPEGSRVVISEPAGDLTTAYAINLDSSPEPFDAGTVQAASAALGSTAYTSQTTIDGVLWHRLRIGPILTRAAAETLLLEAQAKYPRAWLAIADETVIEPKDSQPATAPAAPAAVASGKPDPAAAPALAAARDRFRRKDYDAAVELLTKYLASASGPQRADARELLGLARERNGQLAHAKAEYEAFLREYPDHSHASRVRRRLQALRTAALAGRSGAREGSADDIGWRSFGGVSQMYRRDSNQIDNARTSTDFVSQNAILTDVDALVRRRGFDFDITGRVNAGYAKDLLPDGPGDRVRVSSAFVELASRDRGWATRFGRQSRTAGGVLGVFDGIYGNYQFLPHLSLDAAVGLPVESTRAGVQSERMFEALSLGFGVFDDAWEPGVYVVNQTYNGQTDRQAVGAELRYFRPGRVLVGFADYDVYFQELNSAVLIGTLQLPARWTVNVDLERRNTPVLTTRNALIGQPVPTLDELLGLFSEDQVRQLAIDRTSPTEVYGLTLSRPFAERLQLTLNAASILTGATPPSGGVEGMPATGRELVLSAQLLAASLMRTGDVTVLGLRQQTGGNIETASLGVSSRIPLWGDWRINPQVRADRRLYTLDDTTQWVYVPSLRISLQKRHLLLELEGGAEFASRELATATATATATTTQEDITRYYLSVGYRWAF